MFARPTNGNTVQNENSDPLPRFGGFTLIELLAIIAMLAVLGSMLVTTMATTRTNTFTFQCMNNLRQLGAAWKMYADDNEGRLVYNHDGGNNGLAAGAESWVAGWLDFSSNTANTNIALLIDHTRYPYGAYLGPYLRSASVFKCPADRSVVLQTLQPTPRVRSVSMSNFGNCRTWSMVNRYKLYTDITQFRSPATVFIILEERPDSINDGTFFTDPDTRYQLIDYPASFHNAACNFSFADGHSELHRWTDPRTVPVLAPGQLLQLNVNLPGDVDVDWLAQHASEMIQ
jgi:prepilin-type processing-associated H-X9-DG protein